MQTYHVVLFIHLASLLIAVGAATTLHIADVEIRRARTLGEVGRLGLRMKATAKVFPIAIVGLIGSGIYMTHDVGWGFSAPWVLAGEVGLGAIVLLGDLVNGRNGRKLGETIGAAMAQGGDGPVTPAVQARLDDPLAKFASIAPTALMFGVIYAMTVKPGTLGSTVAMLVALAVGAVASQTLFRPSKASAPEAAAAELA